MRVRRLVEGITASRGRWRPTAAGGGGGGGRGRGGGEADGRAPRARRCRSCGTGGAPATCRAGGARRGRRPRGARWLRAARRGAARAPGGRAVGGRGRRYRAAGGMSRPVRAAGAPGSVVGRRPRCGCPLLAAVCVSVCASWLWPCDWPEAPDWISDYCGLPGGLQRSLRRGAAGGRRGETARQRLAPPLPPPPPPRRKFLLPGLPGGPLRRRCRQTCRVDLMGGGRLGFRPPTGCSCQDNPWISEAWGTGLRLRFPASGAPACRPGVPFIPPEHNGPKIRSLLVSR